MGCANARVSDYRISPRIKESKLTTYGHGTNGEKAANPMVIRVSAQPWEPISLKKHFQPLYRAKSGAYLSKRHETKSPTSEVPYLILYAISSVVKSINSVYIHLNGTNNAASLVNGSIAPCRKTIAARGHLGKHQSGTVKFRVLVYPFARGVQSHSYNIFDQAKTKALTVSCFYQKKSFR